MATPKIRFKQLLFGDKDRRALLKRRAQEAELECARMLFPDRIANRLHA